LYDLLLAPVEPFLDKSKYLCIVADGILNFLPFDALVSSKTGRYLVEDYDIGSAPSSSTFVFLTHLAQRKALNINQSDDVLLSIGDPSFDRRTFALIADLPSAASEVEGISAFYRRSRRLWHEGATETAVRADITSSDTVHFAAHYIPDDNSEILSGFPLSPERRDSSSDDSANGFLQSYEIYHLNLTRPRLVVLAGCQTGVEQHYAGEGAISAARPFMVAGVPTIVASLWHVDSEASAELMIGFHRHRMLDSQPTAHALRLAQLDMIHGTDHRYQQPYFWAGFVTIGGRSSY
jgi:CHAT domain-containing protein